MLFQLVKLWQNFHLHCIRCNRQVWRLEPGDVLPLNLLCFLIIAVKFLTLFVVGLLNVRDCLLLGAEIFGWHCKIPLCFVRVSRTYSFVVDITQLGLLSIVQDRHVCVIHIGVSLEQFHECSFRRRLSMLLFIVRDVCTINTLVFYVFERLKRYGGLSHFLIIIIFILLRPLTSLFRSNRVAAILGLDDRLLFKLHFDNDRIHLGDV